MGLENDLAVIGLALADAAPGPLPEHDAMCRVFSGWPDQQKLGCNCSIARNETARLALERVRRFLVEGAVT